MSLEPFTSLYRYALEPIAPFSWFGIKVCSIELVAALRLCTVLRQVREDLYAKHQRHAGDTPASVEERSFLRDACTSLTIKFGGEAIVGPLLGVPPSFVFSGVSIGVYIAAQAIVEFIPAIPSTSLSTELPLSIVDGFTRALLLCSLIPKSPFWAELHSVIWTVLGNTGDKVGPIDPEAARALCAILAGMFSTQTAKNYGLVWKKGEFHQLTSSGIGWLFNSFAGVAEKIKTL
ncbi:hypothetical protein EDD22DRAFT_934574 [Suillus occidentalis]|nr:hypothetical protein EDD22DRAFT_934574 [Suillus occidentalis]